MAEYTNEERMVLEAEGSAWTLVSAVEHLRDTLSGTAFVENVKTLHRNLVSLARELREYNDGFEVDGDTNTSGQNAEPVRGVDPEPPV